jgi:hypothetical protein
MMDAQPNQIVWKNLNGAASPDQHCTGVDGVSLINIHAKFSVALHSPVVCLPVPAGTCGKQAVTLQFAPEVTVCVQS